MRPRFEPAIASLASALADASRARMLMYLLGGRISSATELAQVAGVSRATASGHLVRLLESHLVRVEQRGRHRYYGLADESVVHLLESLSSVSERDIENPVWRHPARARLKFARRCYGHLAGELGVGLFIRLIDSGAFHPAADGLALTEIGRRTITSLGLDIRPTRGARRFAYACHDWSEGCDHLAGDLADQLLQHLIAVGWLKQGSDRELSLTPKGQKELIPWLRNAGPASS